MLNINSVWLGAFMLTLAGCASSPEYVARTCDSMCQLARRHLANDPIYQQHQRDVAATQARYQAENPSDDQSDDRADRRREFFRNLSSSLAQQHANHCAQLRDNRSANTQATCYTSGGISQCSGQTTPSPLPADCQ